MCEAKLCTMSEPDSHNTVRSLYVDGEIVIYFIIIPEGNLIFQLLT